MAGFIAYDNVLRTATVSSEETAVGYPFANALDGNTASRAGFASGASRVVVLDCGSEKSVSALCLARHNLNTVGATITIKGGSDGSTWPTTLFAETPTSDSVLMFYDDAQSFRYFQITISGHSSTAYIADLFLGPKLDFQRSQRSGFEDILFSDADEITTSTTRGGNIVALNVEVNFKKLNLELHNYSKSWFDTNWNSLKSALKQYPVYVMWGTDKTPFYCWPAKNIASPQYGDLIDFVSVTLQLEGITE